MNFDTKVYYLRYLISFKLSFTSLMYTFFLSAGMENVFIQKNNCLKNFKEFQGFLEIPWKILKVFKCSTLDLILTHLENVTLILALKFEVFRGQFEIALEVFKVPSPLKTLEMFRKGYPWPWKNLEFRGRGRGSLTFKATVANTNGYCKN